MLAVLPNLKRLLGAGAIAVGLALPAVAAETFYRGNSTAPATLDPLKATTAAEANILRDLYEGLFAYGPAGNVMPGVAADWSVSADGLTVTIALRSSAWSNGDPVTAADFARALRRLVDPVTAAPDGALFRGLRNAGAILDGLKPAGALGVRAVDASTLEITLDTPVPNLPHLLARVSAAPRHARAGALDTATPATIVNGPYRVADATSANELTLEANPRFREATDLAIAKVVYRALPPAAALTAFLAGTLHSSNDVPVLALADLRERLTGQLRVAPFLGAYLLAFNTARSPLADVGVRRALALAIDRDHLNEDAWAGTMVPALSLVPDGIDSYGAPATLILDGDLDDRRAAARALLAEAGFGPDRALTLALSATDREVDRLSAAALAEDWSAIGVAVTIVGAAPGEHYEAVAGGRFAAALVGWMGDHDDASAILGLLANGIGPAPAGGEEIAAVLAEADTTWDPEVRSALLFRAETLALRDLPLVPLLHYASLNLVSARIAGWEDNVLDIHPTRWLSLVDEAAPPVAPAGQ